jgi:hypothetical protein
MATTLDEQIAAPRQFIRMTKTASRTAVAASPTSTFDLAGSPGAGVLAGTSTTAGVVPTDATAGCPPINAFAGPTGNLELATMSGSVLGASTLYDMLWKGGPYPFNANVTLSAQPSFLARVPPDDNQTELWIEAVTAFTGNLSVAVGYTNQAGTSGRSTGTVATGMAPIVGRMVQLPLQSGDSGVQQVNTVVATVSTAGTFNVLVLQRLVSGSIRTLGTRDRLDWTQTGRRRMYDTMALIQVSQPDSTATGSVDWDLMISNS